MRTRFIILLTLILLGGRTCYAQDNALNMPEHDDKLYYFGITFGLNFAEYRLGYTANFANTDTFKRIQPSWSPGFNLGLMANLRISKFIDFRFVPSLSFAEKKTEFDFGVPVDSSVTRSIESIYMHLPFQVKFKSDRIKNFRFYGLTGVKLDYDLASNASSRRADEFLKVKALDAGFELGVGFEFFNPNFIFSPEIKLSQGLINQLYRDPSLPLTNALQFLRTRMIVISIHLEG